jgi:hypothetical protein
MESAVIKNCELLNDKAEVFTGRWALEGIFF